MHLGGAAGAPSLVVQDGNSPLDLGQAGNFAREPLEGKLAGVWCEEIICLFG